MIDLLFFPGCNYEPNLSLLSSSHTKISPEDRNRSQKTKILPGNFLKDARIQNIYYYCKTKTVIYWHTNLHDLFPALVQ